MPSEAITGKGQSSANDARCLFMAPIKANPTIYVGGLLTRVIVCVPMYVTMRILFTRKGNGHDETSHRCGSHSDKDGNGPSSCENTLIQGA